MSVIKVRKYYDTVHNRGGKIVSNARIHTVEYLYVESHTMHNYLGMLSLSLCPLCPLYNVFRNDMIQARDSPHIRSMNVNMHLDYQCMCDMYRKCHLVKTKVYNHFFLYLYLYIRDTRRRMLTLQPRVS